MNGCSEIDTCIEQDNASDYQPANGTATTSPKDAVDLVIRHLCRKTGIIRKVSALSLIGRSEHLYTLMRRIRGNGNAEVNISTLLSLKSLSELDAMSVNEFHKSISQVIFSTRWVFDLI